MGLVTLPPDDPARVELTTLGNAGVSNLRQSINSVPERSYGDLLIENLCITHRVLGILTERAHVELGQL